MHALIQRCSESRPSLKESLKLTLSWVRREGIIEQISRGCMQHQKQLKVLESRVETHGASCLSPFCRETILKTISCGLWKVFPEVRAVPGLSHGQAGTDSLSGWFQAIAKYAQGFLLLFTLAHCCVTTLPMEICLISHSLRRMASPPAYSFLALALKSPLVSNHPSTVLSSHLLIPPHLPPLSSKESAGYLLIVQGHRGSRHHTLIWKMPQTHAHIQFKPVNK